MRAIGQISCRSFRRNSKFHFRWKTKEKFPSMPSVRMHRPSDGVHSNRNEWNFVSFHKILGKIINQVVGWECFSRSRMSLRVHMERARQQHIRGTKKLPKENNSSWIIYSFGFSQKFLPRVKNLKRFLSHWDWAPFIKSPPLATGTFAQNTTNLFKNAQKCFFRFR